MVCIAWKGATPKLSVYGVFIALVKPFGASDGVVTGTDGWMLLVNTTGGRTAP